MSSLKFKIAASPLTVSALLPTAFCCLELKKEDKNVMYLLDYLIEKKNVFAVKEPMCGLNSGQSKEKKKYGKKKV